MLQTRTMHRGDFDEVAELIFLSTNSWYLQRLGHRIFQGEPSHCRVFCEVYEDLDPACGLVVEAATTGTIVGSCFTHPRETHLSLGIMNVHPSYFGKGIAAKLLREIVAIAESRDLPTRLVSSALNLDSYSLYNRFGFSPFAIYQDLIITVPEEGLGEPAEGESAAGAPLPSVRPAEPADLLAIGQVEFDVAGISRERDYCFFLENSSGAWDTYVSLDSAGKVDGYLVSVDHPAIRMIGPGAAKNPESAEALLWAQLERFRGGTVVFLLPSTETSLIHKAYRLGARNCELHFGQVRGESQPIQGVVFPTFLPESA